MDPAYVPSQLLVTRPDRFTSILDALRESAAELGWDVTAVTLGGQPVDPVQAEREARAPGRVHPVRPHIVRIAAAETARAAASPVDAARLLRAVTSRHADVVGVELDRIVAPDAATGPRAVPPTDSPRD